MNILRKFGVGLAVTVLSFSLLGLAWSHVMTATVLRRDTIKDWLASSGFYDQITDVVLESASKNQSEGDKKDDLPVDDPQVRAIAKESFSPEFLRSSIEEVLDGTYGWLEGDTDKPAFSIDLAEAKQKFADGLGNYAINRASALPACSNEQLQALMAEGGEFNALTTSCVPPGTDVQAAGAQIRNEILASDEFLEKTSFSASDIKVQENGREVPIDQASNLKSMQDAYQFAKNGPFLFAGLALLAIAAIVFLSASRRTGIRRSGVVFILSGLLVALVWFGLSQLSNLAKTRASDSLNDSSAGKELGLRFVDVVFQDVGKLFQWYGIGFVVLGIAAIIVSWKLGKSDEPEGRKDDSVDPKPPIDDSPKTDLDTVEEEKKPKEPSAKPPRKIQL